jgi:raffinose/stachyose/melibiose transport system permease protein
MGGENIMNKRSLILLEVVLIILAVIMLIPIYYLLVTTFKTPAEAALSPMGLPKVFMLDNYIKAFTAMNYPRALLNNVIVNVSSVSLLVAFSSMAAYVIARRPEKMYKRIYGIFMIGLMVPFQISLIPLYKVVSGLGVMNSLVGVILVSVFCINMSFSIFLFKGFINTIPFELEEAAAIDGCRKLRIYWVIVFPLLKPIIATVCILNALAVWNDFMTPLLSLQSPSKAVILLEVYKNVGPFSTDWTAFFPMMVLGVTPMVIFYLFMQRFIINGVVAGSVKG